MRVEPVDSEFERSAGVEAGGAGVGENHGFRFCGGDEDVGPFGLEEAEVRHGSEFAAKGAVLEGGEEGVEFGKRGLR